MIVCNEHEFIFLKSGKTAGTSLEIGLSKFCGPSDIITEIYSPEDEAIRTELGYPGPRNYLIPPRRYNLKDWARLTVKRTPRKFYNHIGAEEARRYMSKRVWDRYFKFCVVRNPFDLVISFYYWRCQDEPRPSIMEFLRTGPMHRLKETGYDLYTSGGEVAVDHLMRYERLADELDELRERLGLPSSILMPRAKGGFRKDRRPYREVIGKEERRVIEEMFSKELDLLGYEF